MFETVLSTIDLRSFSNAWFWIMLVLAWSSMTASLVGVPYDMVVRARRHGGQAMLDLETQALVQSRRRIAIIAQSGVALMAIWAAMLTMFVTLGFVYGFEMAQALAFLLLPLSIAVLIGLPLTHRIAAGVLTGEQLVKSLMWHRFKMMSLGLVSILLTTLWGMVFNLVMPTLG